MSEIVSKYIECFVYKNHIFAHKFLLLKRSESTKVHPGIWQIVTAKIDSGEKACETVKREVVEETGLQPVKILVGPYLNQFYDYEKDTINMVPVFIAEVDTEDVKISEEHCEYEWLSFEDAMSRLHWINQKERLGEIYKYLKTKDLLNTLVQIP